MITTDLFKHKFIPAKKKSDYLMIVLHGRGDSIRPFRQFDDELNIPEMNYLLLNAPRKFMTGYTWYGEPPYQANGVLKIREKLFTLLNELENQGWKSENIFFFGFSQGCLISADIGLNYPKQLGGVVGISGYFNFYPRWKNNLADDSKKTPWMFTHGHADDILPLPETKYGVEKLKSAGLKVEWVEMEKKHTLEVEEYPLIRKWVRNQLSTLSKN
ncbi:serine esterase [Bdellovibrio sp. ZAP7]|uniref:alpha/beta hydrolase n=1 Tax=Bdellovibrio sp. ZAP7 TaxID=2231053 RepID=UPI00115730BA|nr:serine esterase [Bdellovibrio sp. ZAP7]QDK46943.1 serine esterase [Bdellovibrio sp. ZAP7]